MTAPENEATRSEIVRLPEAAYRVLDRLDERMIEAELAGYEARELIYGFRIEGREITGLSWVGAKALARWMADKGHPMDVVEKEITGDDEAWYADVRVVDKGTGLALWGSSKCNKTRRLRTGEVKPDQFARTIALNKAQRNGILAHVPDKMIAQFIKRATDEGKVRRVLPKEVEAAGPARRPAEDAVPPAPGRREVRRSRSLDELEYQLRGHIIDLEGTLSLTETAEGLRIERRRYLDDDEWAMINDVIASLGGEWVSAGKQSRWKIPSGD